LYIFTNTNQGSLAQILYIRIPDVLSLKRQMPPAMYLIIICLYK